MKARLSEIADEVDRTHARVSITRNGRAFVVLMSAADLESMEATMELLVDAEAIERLRAAEAEVAFGDVVTRTDMERLMAERRASGR